MHIPKLSGHSRSGYQGPREPPWRNLDSSKCYRSSGVMTEVVLSTHTTRAALSLLAYLYSLRRVRDILLPLFLGSAAHERDIPNALEALKP